MFHLHAALDPAAGALVATVLTAVATPMRPTYPSHSGTRPASGAPTRPWTSAQAGSPNRPGRPEGSRPCRIPHVVFWEHDGPTDLDNGVLPCPHHHRRIHEGGWRLAMDPAAGHRVTVVSPSGRTRRTSMPEGFRDPVPEGFDLEAPGHRRPG